MAGFPTELQNNHETWNDRDSYTEIPTENSNLFDILSPGKLIVTVIGTSCLKLNSCNRIYIIDLIDIDNISQ